MQVSVEALAPEEQPRASATMTTMTRAGPEEQCDGLIALYEAKAKSQFDLNLLEAAIESANLIQHDYRRGGTLKRIATHLVAAGANQRAYELSGLIGISLDQSRAFKEVAAAMTRAGDSRAPMAFARALSAARQIEDPSEGAGNQARALTEIAEELVRIKDAQATRILAEALEDADRIAITWQRFSIYTDIATAWARLGDFDRVFQVALRIKNHRDDADEEEYRHGWLAEIARLLVTLRMFDMAVEITGWIRDDPAQPESTWSTLLEIASAFARLA